ncbi:MAG: hypothetical protein ACKV19_28355 [Verrucomicrobiales bacterium]
MTTSPTFEEVSARLVALVGPGAREVREVREGAYSRASRWLVTWPNGDRAFVKAGYYPDRDHGLHLEAIVCGGLGAVCLPRLLGWDAGDAANGEPELIVLEDLSQARWNPPVTARDAAALRAALDQLAEAPAPAALRVLDPMERHMRHAWNAFASTERDAVLATGLVDEGWLDAHGAALARIEQGARLDGDRLVHGDLWMQNWCRVDGRGAVIVDWSCASRANARINQAWAECAVRAAGGPGGVVLPAGAADEPAWAAWMCGRALDYAVGVHNEPRERLVETVRREAAAALEWLCQACDWPIPRIAPHVRVNRAWRP